MVSEPEFMPIQENWNSDVRKKLRNHPRRIPWRVIAGHERQSQKNHDQSLEEIARRCGFSPCEAVAVIEDRPWHRMDQQAAVDRLNELVAAAAREQPKP